MLSSRHPTTPTTLFTLARPEGVAQTPVIVEVPHAGTLVPPSVLARMVAPARCVVRDADLWVDEIYGSVPTVGATLLAAHYSRYVVDLNRADDAIDSESVEGADDKLQAPRGVIWRLSSDRDRVLTSPLPRVEFEARLRTYYAPYHLALHDLIREVRKRFGYAIVLAAHSMPSVNGPRTGVVSDVGSVRARADFVPGTRGRTSASGRLIDWLDAFLKRRNYDVRHDVPYAGGFTTQHYGRPADGVHVIQLEMARRLYMDEQACTRRPVAFETLQNTCRDLVAEIATVVP
ncbi:MAG: N-formylglutamate amidohydrolase [Polyangiaceae bacterium]